MNTQASPLATGQPTAPIGAVGLVPRPPFHLRSLPIRYRWEFTRRHPDYHDWWTWAQHPQQITLIESPAESELRRAAIVILGAIGVSGTLPNPRCEFNELDGETLNPAWLSGAVQPLSMRSIASLLLASLPSETLGFLALQFLKAGTENEETNPLARIEALIALSSKEAPGLNDLFDEPIVSVNPAAAQRQVVEALGTLLAQWKAERELSERRDRSDRYPAYLAVWDLREGWQAGRYDRTRELRLADVARELSLSVSTVHHHYTSAFELIVGHRYSPELWYRLFGALKLCDLFGDTVGTISRRRPLRSRVGRDIPDTVLNAAAGQLPDRGPSFVGSNSGDDQGLLDLVNDIRNLIAEGKTDRQIVNKLGLHDESITAIAYLRQHEDIQEIT